jgi:outer membrane lipoprotein-sorting protein
LEAEQPVTLKLFPLDAGEAGFIDHLTIVFSADQRYVAEVLMMEQGGDSTRLRFADVQINQALPEDAFEAPAAQ